MTARFNFIPTALYRRLLPGPALTIGAVQVEPGDWIDQTLVAKLDRAGRQRLGPTTSAAHVERESGVRPEQGQHHVRAAKPSVPAAAAPNIGVYIAGDDLAAAEEIAKRAAATAHVPILTAWGPAGWDALRECDVSVQIHAGDDLGTGWLVRALREAYDEMAIEGAGGCLETRFDGDISSDEARAAMALHMEPYAPGRPVLLLDPGVELDQYSIDRLVFLLLDSAPNVGAVFPAHNLGEPCSLPSPGEDGPPWPRLPGGKHPQDIADALLADGAPPVPGRPANPGAVLLRRDVAEALARGERPAFDAVTCLTAFCWRPEDKRGPVAELLGGEAPAMPWAPVVDRARRAVAASKPRGLPVALYSSNIGPWGGVAVLFRLADELQRLGISAAVVHHSTTEHRLRPMTSPLKVRNPSSLVTDWPAEVGWRDGILVGSHWGSGRGVREIVARHPGVIPTSFLQDREDLFEDEAGRPAGMSKYREYLQIGRGVSVAQWIIDSAAAELGLDPTHYQVIQPGVDCSVFKPAPRTKGGPIRIVAMWRPQTAIRRGIARLRATYEALHARFGGRVSLEVFGWNAPSGPGRAPDFVRHHGHLSQLQVAALLAQADIVVEPSDYQGFGLPGLEAMACGAALVSTACRGVDEYVANGENALVVPHDALADAVARVVEDDALRERLQEVGPETARRFDWPLVGARWALYLRNLWELAGGAAVHREAIERAADRADEVLEGSR